MISRKPSKFFVSISSPRGSIFEGTIMALRLKNELGSFDVIERHTNFISAIQEKIIVFDLDMNKKEFPIDTGILKITLNKVEIFVGIEPLPETFAS